MAIDAPGALTDRPATGGGSRYAVVGAGISGIAAAYYLRGVGCVPTLVEQEDRIGGRTRSGWLGEREVTMGGKNIGRRYRCFREFARSVGADDFEPFGINSARAEGDRIRTVDSKRSWRSAANLLAGAGTRDVARLVHLGLRVKASEENRYLGSRYFGQLGRRRDDRRLSAYFGPRLNAALLRPMTVRMNGAEPDEVHLGTFGSNLGTLLDSYDQPREGMRVVLERFVQSVPVEVGTRVESLVVRDGRVVGLRVLAEDGSTEDQEYDGVVIATPAFAAAPLLREHHPALSAALEEVRYFPAAVVVAEYEREIFPEHLRALVFGEHEPVSNAGAYGIHDRNVVRYTFSGRAARPLLGDDFDAEKLLAVAEERLGRHFPVSAEDRRNVAVQRWPAAYCAYLPRHADFLNRVDSALEELPGLHLTGDYLRGASIEACFRSARDCAARVAHEAART
jgi:oxygen-dependent protoporphyrinogen oxidase